MSLALALGWKYENAPGIATVSGVLTGWPEALGTAPTASQQTAIMAEYEAFLSTPKVEDYQVAVQTMVDETARAQQFNDGVTLSSYVASTVEQWAAQAQAFVAWRDDVWQYAYRELARVQGGEREQPTVKEFLEELPAIIWP